MVLKEVKKRPFLTSYESVKLAYTIFKHENLLPQKNYDSRCAI